MIASPLDSASRWLNWSNVLYVGGAALTVATAMFVLWENQAVASGKRVKFFLLSEFAVALAAIVSLIGTIGAIHFSNTVSHIKDVELDLYRKSSDVKIAQANESGEAAKRAAAVALQNAASANIGAGQASLKAENTAKSNSELRIEVAKAQADAKTSAASLFAETQKASQLAQGVASQQQSIQREIQGVPSLSDDQVTSLGHSLRRFLGQPVEIHNEDEIHSRRFADALSYALFRVAFMKNLGRSNDSGLDIRGITVSIHALQGRPQAADAIVDNLTALGFAVKSRINPSVPEGTITIWIGPA